uniref:Uncharacterized protein n=1 Tax=Panagrellus redivivus TaxID=6233 RepID=A0A7E4WE99_PANRE
MVSNVVDVAPDTFDVSEAPAVASEGAVVVPKSIDSDATVLHQYRWVSRHTFGFIRRSSGFFIIGICGTGCGSSSIIGCSSGHSGFIGRF